MHILANFFGVLGSWRSTGQKGVILLSLEVECAGRLEASKGMDRKIDSRQYQNSS
jgi:hypothetical protein